MKHRPTTISLSVGVVAACALVLAAASSAGGYRLISYASDSGVHHASSGFDTGVAKPKAMKLDVAVDPDKRIKIEYQVGCRGHGHRSTVNKTTRTRSSEIDLPLRVTRPRTCLVYAFVTYNNPSFDQLVNFRVELRAKQRPGASRPD